MSRENMEIVRKLNDVYNERSFAENPDLIDPDIVWDMSRMQIPDSSAYAGRGGLREFVDTWTESFASEHIEAEDMVDGGDRVLVVVHHSGRGKMSAMVWTLRDGRAVRMEMYPTREEALEAMGLGE